MTKRVIVAVVLIPVLLLVLFWAPIWLLPIAVSALAATATHEVLWSTGFVKNPRVSALAIVLAALIPIWVYAGEEMMPALLTLFVYVVLLFAIAMASKHKVTMEKMGGSFFLSIMIPYFLASFVRIRALPDWNWYILVPFVVAFCSDAFALFAGLLFGKHKLAPALSPKKTVEGAIGGVVGSVLCTLLYGLVLQLAFGCAVSYPLLALYALFGSLASQFGDLAFSYIKRQYHVKDYGNIFPGHGGVLDRFDSVIFCVPLMELFFAVMPAIVGPLL